MSLRHLQAGRFVRRLERDLDGADAVQHHVDPTAVLLVGLPRTKDSPLDTKVFTGEFRVDTNFTYSFNKPADDTIVGSSEIFRSGEFQLTQLGIGGDFHHDNVVGRVMTQFGMYTQTMPGMMRARVVASEI